MPKQAQQRFVDLAVGEVSLVDSPANERVFNVVKSLNQENGDMADTTTDVNKNDAQVETVPVDVAKATNEAVEKAMSQVTALVEGISKAVGEEPAADAAGATETEVAKTDGEGDTEVVDTEKAVDKAKKAAMLAKLQKSMEKKGLKGDALKSAVDVAMRSIAATGAFKPGGDTEPPEKKTTKNVDGDNAEAPALDQEAVIQETLKAIQVGLAGAQQAPQTQDAVKAAIAALQNLEKAMSMQKVPANASPSTTVPSTTQFGSSGLKDITKALAGITEALQGVQNVNKSLAERVDGIESTRLPSTSESGTDGTTTQTTQKSIWSGVL